MKKLLLALVCLGMLPSAFAGFFVEPYVGYGLGDGERQTSAGATIADEEWSGPLFGARVGGSTMMLNYGVDYSRRLEFDHESKTNGVTTKNKMDGSYLGAFLGVDFPVLVRAWASYYFDVSMEDQDGTNKGNEVSGNGYALGVGFTGLPFVSLNLEYRMLDFDEIKDVTTGQTTTPADYTAKELIFSVSVPLDL